MKDCIFCKIGKHEAPANVVYEDELVIAILDIDPITKGHSLIIPKEDIRDIHSLPSETGRRIMEVAKLLAGIIENEFQYDGSMIMEVNGAFQDVPHFHLHVFGRNKDKDLSISYPNIPDLSEDEMNDIAEKISTKLNRIK